MRDSAMKGYIELTDSLGQRCTLRVNSISQVCERKHYRNYELDDHPELREKDENGKIQLTYRSILFLCFEC